MYVCAHTHTYYSCMLLTDACLSPFACDTSHQTRCAAGHQGSLQPSCVFGALASAGVSTPHKSHSLSSVLVLSWAIDIVC